MRLTVDMRLQRHAGFYGMLPEVLMQYLFCKDKFAFWTPTCISENDSISYGEGEKLHIIPVEILKACS